MVGMGNDKPAWIEGLCFGFCIGTYEGVYSIELDNQNADSEGTKKIYEKYSDGYYTDVACNTQITTSTNRNNSTNKNRVHIWRILYRNRRKWNTIYKCKWLFNELS